MAIRHVVTIQVAPGRTGDFASAFKVLQQIAQQGESNDQDPWMVFGGVR